MLYSDLNLKQLRIDADIDFAHYTYKKGQCSCCYGPKDQAAKYWRDGKITEAADYEYILFKNADNGSGCVSADDIIRGTVCVSWKMSKEKLEKVCELLRKQFTPDYHIFMPLDDFYTIIITSDRFTDIYGNSQTEKYKNDPKLKHMGEGLRDKTTLKSYRG